MNLNQLRVFEAVARTGSFSRAAETLSVTQPAVTLQIRQLERDCGVQLFERIRRRPRLTDAGRVLQDYARRIFALVEEASRHLEGARGLTTGTLRVVTGPTGATYVTDLITAFHRRHPGIHVALSLDVSEGIVQRVVTLVDDVGLLGAEQQHPALARRPFYGDPLVVIVAPRHPWARRRSVSVRELAAGTLRALAIRERGFVHPIDLVYHRDRSASPLIAAVLDVARTLRVSGRTVVSSAP